MIDIGVQGAHTLKVPSTALRASTAATDWHARVLGGQSEPRRTHMAASTLRRLHDIGETVASADKESRS